MSRAVAVLRANYATRIGDESFETLIALMREKSPDFARLWEQRRTMPLDSIHVRMVVPELGKLTFLSTRFVLPHAVDHVAFFLSHADPQQPSGHDIQQMMLMREQRRERDR
jgi:hypothetical protein